MTLFALDTVTISHDYQRSTMDRSGIHRVFTAAIVNSQFREKLLREPEMALAGGYLGQTFALTDQERTIISNVRASNLTDFAQKVNQALKAL
ncbi:MAG: hypothetical protein AB1509_15515 [Chloroflexota bacterium]